MAKIPPALVRLTGLLPSWVSKTSPPHPPARIRRNTKVTIGRALVAQAVRVSRNFRLGNAAFHAKVCGMPNSADALRRWLGAFCLAVAAGMLIWGQTILLPILQGVVFLIYWALCFVFTVG